MMTAPSGLACTSMALTRPTSIAPPRDCGSVATTVVNANKDITCPAGDYVIVWRGSEGGEDDPGISTQACLMPVMDVGACYEVIGHGSGTINANSYRAVPDCKPSDFTSVGPNGSRSGVARLVKVLDSEKAACPKKVPPIMTFADPSRRYCFADV